MIQTLVRLTPKQHGKLRKIAFDKRISVTELVRQVVEKYLKGK
jgi:hypothetical protein